MALCNYFYCRRTNNTMGISMPCASLSINKDVQNTSALMQSKSPTTVNFTWAQVSDLYNVLQLSVRVFRKLQRKIIRRLVSWLNFVSTATSRFHFTLMMRFNFLAPKPSWTTRTVAHHVHQYNPHVLLVWKALTASFPVSCIVPWCKGGKTDNRHLADTHHP